MRRSAIFAAILSLGLSQCVVAFASLPTPTTVPSAAKAYQRAGALVNPSLRASKNHHEERTMDEWVRICIHFGLRLVLHSVVIIL